MSSIEPYRQESEWKCNPCDCTCTLDCDECDMGTYRCKVWFKNSIETLMASLFFAQFIVGCIFVTDNIYSNVYELNNGTICDISDLSLISMDIQKLMILTGMFGFLMMSFRMVNFNLLVYYEEHTYLIMAFDISFWIALLVTVIFMVYEMAFLFMICRYFEKLFSIYIISLIYNFFAVGSLILLFITDKVGFKASDARSLLLRPVDRRV